MNAISASWDNPSADIIGDLRKVAQAAMENTTFVPNSPLDQPDWVETAPVRTAINRLTGERLYFDAVDGLWHYMHAPTDATVPPEHRNQL